MSFTRYSLSYCRTQAQNSQLNASTVQSVVRAPHRPIPPLRDSVVNVAGIEAKGVNVLRIIAVEMHMRLRAEYDAFVVIIVQSWVIKPGNQGAPSFESAVPVSCNLAARPGWRLRRRNGVVQAEGFRMRDERDSPYCKYCRTRDGDAWMKWSGGIGEVRGHVPRGPSSREVTRTRKAGERHV